MINNNDIGDPKYNRIRKQLLIKKENKENVSNIDLGFYELTPYYSSEEPKNFVEKILFYENETRLIRHIKDQKLYLMPEQEKVINEIDKYQKMIIAAPTSFGKTLILKEYIYRKKPNKIVFIVPTNALAYELEKDFKSSSSLFLDYTIFDKSMANLEFANSDAKLLFIGTQEKFLETQDCFKHIDLFIIDEAYKLQETPFKMRGYKLSLTFINSIKNKASKIILLSPNGKFIGFDEFNIIETYFNAVDKVFEKVNEAKFIEKLYACSLNEKTILYCKSPETISNISKDIKPLNNGLDKEYINFLENEYHKDWSVIGLLKKGILTHHGMMPKYIQNKMINLFLNSPKYNLLIGTNSISEGINTPTKNLFIYGKEANFKDKLLIKNTIGRAGRLGKYPIGHIYTTFNPDSIESNQIEIVLSLVDEDKYSEISDLKNDEIASKFCDKFEIDYEFYKTCLLPMGLSERKLNLIMEQLKEDLEFPDISCLPYLAYKVFKDDYGSFHLKEDSILIKGVLTNIYYVNNSPIKINNFEDKINYFRYKVSKNKHLFKNVYENSAIIEKYMRFTFSTLEYYILPIIEIADKLNQFNPKWKFGKNVCIVAKKFLKAYYKNICGFNLNDLTPNQNKIVQCFKELGIPLAKIKITKDFIKEIENKLNLRFSTYDVINAVYSIDKETNKYKFDITDRLRQYL